MESLFVLVSDHRDGSYVLVGARSNFWSDRDLSSEVESHDAAGSLCIEVRTAWLEHPVERSDTDHSAVIERCVGGIVEEVEFTL